MERDRRKTKVEPKTGDWEVKVKVWERQARNEKISGIQRHFELNAGEEGYLKEAPDPDTIKKICNELPQLPPELVLTLPPEVQVYAQKLNPQLKEELERLKGNSSQQARSEKSEQDPQIIEARRKHFEDLCQLVREWTRQLYYSDDPDAPLDLFPTVFNRSDAKPSRHYRAGFLNWSVEEDGSVRVWFDIEKHFPFDALREHLPNKELWAAYEDLKLWLGKAIQQAGSKSDTFITVRHRTRPLLKQIEKQLEIALARRIFPGKCEVCRKY